MPDSSTSSTKYRNIFVDQRLPKRSYFNAFRKRIIDTQLDTNSSKLTSSSCLSNIINTNIQLIMYFTYSIINLG